MLWGSDCFESIQGEHYYVVLWPLIEVCTPFISPKPPLWDIDKVKVKYYAYNKKTGHTPAPAFAGLQSTWRILPLP
jgi:hypothetical protein